MIVQISNIRVPLSRARNSKVLSSFFPNDTHAFTHTLRISDAPVLLLQRWLEHTRRKVSERVKASWGVCRESSPTSAFANRRARNTIIPWNRGKVESLNECRVSGPRKRANARLGERERERESALPLSERGWCSVWSCVDSRARFLTSVKDEDDSMGHTYAVPLAFQETDTSSKSETGNYSRLEVRFGERLAARCVGPRGARWTHTHEDLSSEEDKSISGDVWGGASWRLSRSVRVVCGASTSSQRARERETTHARSLFRLIFTSTLLETGNLQVDTEGRLVYYDFGMMDERVSRRFLGVGCQTRVLYRFHRESPMCSRWRVL